MRRFLVKLWRLRHPVRYTRNLATYRGRYGYQPGWRKVYYTFVVADVVKAATKPAPVLVATDRLEPGQGVSIRTIDPVEERKAKRRR